MKSIIKKRNQIRKRMNGMKNLNNGEEEKKT